MAENKFMQVVRALLALTIALLLLPAIIYVSWNMFAPELLGLPAMTFKHAFGLFLFVGTMALLVQMWGMRNQK